MKLQRRFGWVCAVVGLACILVATLTPIPGGVASVANTTLWCLVCGAHGGVDVTLNVLLFIPFAIGLRAAGVPARRVVVIAAALSFFVESMQFAVITGRDASVSDLITNTIGGGIGAFLGARLPVIFAPRAATARTLARSWAVAWLVLWTISAWLLMPWAPTSTMATAWGIRLPDYADFRGKVLAVAGDLPAAPGPIPDRFALARHLATGQFAFTVDAVAGTPHATPAPVVAVLHESTLFGILYDVHDDLVLELPTRAHLLRFRAPAMRLDAGLRSGTPVRITAGLRGRTLELAAAYDGGGWERKRSLALSPSFGWSLLLPFDYAYGPKVQWLTGLWIAGMLLPLGYWSARGWPAPWRVALGWAAVVAIGLGGIPRLAGYAPVQRPEWLAAAAGILAGWALARAVIYLGRRCASPSTGEFCSS